MTNNVNDGAETITDNHLYIYGKGTYMLRDNLPSEVINKAVQVSYKDNEGLVFKITDDKTE